MSDQRPSPDALPAGTLLERYRIERVLGRGGFAFTYLAHHHELGQAVALKEYFPRGEGRRDSSLRVVSTGEVFADGRMQFLAEGRKLAKLSGTPNVVRVIDLFEALGTAYLVMEYEAGETLEAMIQRGKPPDEAFVRKIASRLLVVLATLHQKPEPDDIVHRDISPSNIILRRDGEPVLIDFGAARSDLARLTRDVTRVVKDGYSPPEQYSNTASEQGPWNDLYALGATLHHLVTGQLPVCATDRTQALLRRRPDPHTPAAVAAAGRYSEALLRWIDRLTAIHSDERPASAMLAKQMLDGSQPPAAAGAAASGPTKPLDPKYRFDAAPGSKAHKAAPIPAPAERTGPATSGNAWWPLWTLLLLGMAGATVWWWRQQRPQTIPDVASTHVAAPAMQPGSATAPNRNDADTGQLETVSGAQRTSSVEASAFCGMDEYTVEVEKRDSMFAEYRLLHSHVGMRPQTIYEADDFFDAACVVRADGKEFILFQDVCSGSGCAPYNYGLIEAESGQMIVSPDADGFADNDEEIWQQIKLNKPDVQSLPSSFCCSAERKMVDPPSVEDSKSKSASDAIDGPKQELKAIEPQMVTLPAGSFVMGSPETEEGRESDESPLTTISVASFRLAKYEVTVGEFRRFLDSTGYRTDAENDVDVPDAMGDWAKGPNPGCYGQPRGASAVLWSSTLSWRDPGFDQGGDHPVVCVSWRDTQAYIEWLNRETGKLYRLPSEAEQEYAIRAGSRSPYAWGTDVNQACTHGNVKDSQWTGGVSCADGADYTSRVGQYAANAYGLNDTVGNVVEWGHDCYQAYPGGSRSNSAVEETNCELRILRGGAWDGLPAWLRSAFRYWSTPVYRSVIMGFRLAEDL